MAASVLGGVWGHGAELEHLSRWAEVKKDTGTVQGHPAAAPSRGHGSRLSLQAGDGEGLGMMVVVASQEPNYS